MSHTQRANDRKIGVSGYRRRYRTAYFRYFFALICWEFPAFQIERARRFALPTLVSDRGSGARAKANFLRCACHAFGHALPSLTNREDGRSLARCHDHLISASLLRCVRRTIGCAKPGRSVQCGRLRRHSDADRDALTRQQRRLRHQPTQRLSQPRSACGRDPTEQKHKLFSASAEQLIARTFACVQHRHSTLKNPVAQRVAVLVVDGLEVVKVCRQQHVVGFGVQCRKSEWRKLRIKISTVVGTRQRIDDSLREQCVLQPAHHTGHHVDHHQCERECGKKRAAMGHPTARTVMVVVPTIRSTASACAAARCSTK